MKSAKILYSKGANDECYTPDYAVKPILKYIPQGAVIWCPFDKINSQFVQQITRNNNTVIASHIDNGVDFLTKETKFHWDIIISNPPFTNKRKFFERALSFGKPFALLMANTWLNDSAPMQLFKKRDLQLLMFDRRIRFDCPDGRPNNKITFSSSYFCCDFLPKQIVMESLIDR